MMLTLEHWQDAGIIMGNMNEFDRNHYGIYKYVEYEFEGNWVIFFLDTN